MKLLEQLPACVFSKSELLVSLLTSCCYIWSILIHRLKEREGGREGRRERGREGRGGREREMGRERGRMTAGARRQLYTVQGGASRCNQGIGTPTFPAG